MKFTKQEIRNLKRLCDAVSKVKDKVNLRPGDWFYYHTINSNLFKVIAIDRLLEGDSNDHYDIIVQQYDVVFVFDRKGFEIRAIGHAERKKIYKNDLRKIVVFGSAQEALKYLNHYKNVISTKRKIK